MWLKNNCVLLKYGSRSIRRYTTDCDSDSTSASSSFSCSETYPMCPCQRVINYVGEITQGGKHISCIEFKTDSSVHEITTIPSRDSYDYNRQINGVSCGYRTVTNLCIPGMFDIMFRWDSGHSPYPELSKMTIIVFGTVVRDDEKMPCACEREDYETVARVTIHDDKTITVERIGGSGGSGDSSSSSSDVEEDDVQ